MRQRPERGATVLEAAVTMMLLFTLLFGIIEFGRAFFLYQTLTDSAREGARYSVAPMQGTSTLPTTQAVQTYVNSFLTAANVKNATVNVNQTVNGTLNGLPVVYTQVDVAAPYQFLFFKFGTLNLSSTAVMRNETN